jgi:hypothetical protein
VTEDYCWYERDLVSFSGVSGFAHSHGRIKRTNTGTWKIGSKRYRTYNLAFAALYRNLSSASMAKALR